MFACLQDHSGDFFNINEVLAQHRSKVVRISKTHVLVKLVYLF